MRIVIEPDAAQAVDQAADVIEELIRAKPAAVLGIATGSTPEPLYAELARRRGSGLDTTGLRIVSLDEYVGLSGDHVESYRRFAVEHILQPLGIPEDSAVLPDGAAADPHAAASEFGRAITELGGVDLQILGVGGNGHIAFNEPGSTHDSITRVVELSQSTIEANSRFFESPAEVPRTAITQGVGTILGARRILMLAFGPAKADAIASMIEGPVTTEVPASALCTHAAFEVFLDAGAAARLRTHSAGAVRAGQRSSAG